MGSISASYVFAVLYIVFCLTTVGNAFTVVPQSRNYAVERHEALNSIHEKHVDDDGSHHCSSSLEMDRRKALSCACATSLFAAITTSPSSALAADAPLAPITDKVYMDVRISRSDGTFYVRDDLPDIQENKVFYGKLVMGLFGKTAPTAVERFLSYVNVPYSPSDDDAPLPSYSRSSFKSLDQSTGK